MKLPLPWTLLRPSTRTGLGVPFVLDEGRQERETWLHWTQPKKHNHTQTRTCVEELYSLQIYTRAAFPRRLTVSISTLNTDLQLGGRKRETTANEKLNDHIFLKIIYSMNKYPIIQWWWIRHRLTISHSNVGNRTLPYFPLSHLMVGGGSPTALQGRTMSFIQGVVTVPLKVRIRAGAVGHPRGT